MEMASTLDSYYRNELYGSPVATTATQDESCGLFQNNFEFSGWLN